ncbi:MAG: hypothetical protein IJS20_03245 [Bacteroidales bacterium]|nr:hypothetical protein [Bacteroidales bacterium]
MHWRIHIFAIFATTNHPQTMSKQKRTSLAKKAITSFLQDPFFYPLERISSSKGLTTLIILFFIALICSLGLGFWGYAKYLDTMFSSHISIGYIFLFIWGSATIGALFANKFKWRGLYEHDSKGKLTVSYNYSSWFIFMLCLTSLSFFILFKGNDLGGGEPQQIQARIINIRTIIGKNHEHKAIDMEFNMPPYHHSEVVGLNHRYNIGQQCIITYHKGLFGWNVFDSIEQAY